MQRIIISSLILLTQMTAPSIKAQLLQSYGHTGKISALSFSPDGKHLVSGSCDPVDYSFESHYLIIANIGRKTIEFLSAKNYNCSPLAIFPDSKTLIFEGEDNTLQYWDITQGNFKEKNIGEWEDFLMISPDGMYIACKGEGNIIKVLNASNQELISTVPARAIIGFSSDGQRMITESFGRILQLWNVRENVLIKSLDQIVHPYNQLPFVTHDLAYLATSKNKVIEIWDINKGQIIKSIPQMFSGNFEPIIALSIDGNFLAAGAEQKILAWETFSGKLIIELNVSDNLEVSKLTFSPNGKYLASASTSGHIETKNGQTKSNVEGMVHIWNLEGNEPNPDNNSEIVTTSNKSIQTIKMSRENGVYKVPCKINGLSLSFIIDTGASDVSISLTEALFMLKNGYLIESDIKRVEKYRIANGQIAEGTKITLRSVKIGNQEITNVEATVLHNTNSPLLFGLSALQRFGKVELDYEQQTLRLGKVDNLTKPSEQRHSQSTTTAEEQAKSYIKSGISKYELYDYDGAIADLTQAINILPSDPNAYELRGIFKSKLQDYVGAIADFDTVIEINPKSASTHFGRALAKLTVGQIKNGCQDLEKAAELGYNDANEAIKNYCK